MVLEVQSLTWTKLKGSSASWRPRREPIFLSFSASRGFQGFFFFFPHSIFKASNGWLSPSHPAISFLLLSWPDKGLCDHTEPSRVIQAPFSISRSLTQSHLQSPFCQVRKHIFRFRGFGCGHPQGPLFCQITFQMCNEEVKDLIRTFENIWIT